ncbi:hypothetical protein FOPE_00698 [Fonsecaea pedrosoi]|nr:hypothetical protein FOPE_00698 [Fonsecaea pedrosoi]
MMGGRNDTRRSLRDWITELEKIIKEMKSARRLMPEEEVSGMAFTNQGNMENYMNQDKGYLVVNREKAQTRNLVIQQKEDLSFREPVGVHLIQAPYMNPKLFIGRESKMAQMQEILRPGGSS